MKKIPLTKGLVALVDDEDFEFLSSHAWFAALNGHGGYYAARNAKTDRGWRLLRMHRVLLCAQSGECVDHINGDGLDNRRHNLRLATKAQNSANMRNTKGGTSRFKGVSANHGGKWRAQIRVPGRKIWLGLHETEMRAAMAYDEAAKRLHGEFACLNFPEEKKD